MSDRTLGWQQLKRQKVRFLVAILGVGLAVTLMLMQMGFREAMFESGIRMQKLWNYDLVLFNPATVSIIRPRSFTSRRIYQALSVDGVESVRAVYMEHGQWKELGSSEAQALYVIGFDPDDSIFKLDEVHKQLHILKMQDQALFDGLARPEFGPVADILAEQGLHTVEINGHKVEIRGLFPLGPSFGINGTLLVSSDNFLRLYPERPRNIIDIGLLRLRPGADHEAVKAQLRQYLPRDVLVYDRQEFMQKEMDYWDTNTPIGYVFGFGIIVGLVVGGIIVYQILFADVNDHLPEYATLKAMGYSNFFLAKVVMQEAVLLATIGFLPGLGLAWYLYGIAGDALQMHIIMERDRALLVLGLTVVMCVVSGLLALRKVRAADPASIF